MPWYIIIEWGTILEKITDHNKLLLFNKALQDSFYCNCLKLNTNMSLNFNTCIADLQGIQMLK